MKTQKEISKMSTKELNIEERKLPPMLLSSSGKEYRKKIIRELVKREKRK